ncbi:MAG: cell division protein FtsZ, partial [bacterium]|nr:cell division protein FtsZ [bacterium]
VNEAAKLITGTADPSARVIFGAVLDDSLKDEIKITVIATGFSPASMPSSFVGMKAQPVPPPRSSYTPPAPRPQPQQKQEEKTSARPFDIKPVKREESRPAPVKAAAPADEEDLEIPAFIRRKLGN